MALYYVKYRNVIHEIQERINELNTDVERLRDFASPDEEDYFNNVRVSLNSAVVSLIRLDESISNERAEARIRGGYNESE